MKNDWPTEYGKLKKERLTHYRKDDFMSDCIFCKIIAGEIPSVKVYEDEHVYAFMDIMPLSKVHTLLIPKTHRPYVYDMTPEEAGQLFSVAPKIASAIKETFEPEGMNLLNN